MYWPIHILPVMGLMVLQLAESAMGQTDSGTCAVTVMSTLITVTSPSTTALAPGTSITESSISSVVPPGISSSTIPSELSSALSSMLSSMMSSSMSPVLPPSSSPPSSARSSSSSAVPAPTPPTTLPPTTSVAAPSTSVSSDPNVITTTVTVTTTVTTTVTETVTVTAPASTLTITAPGSTVTLPASTATITTTVTGSASSTSAAVSSTSSSASSPTSVSSTISPSSTAASNGSCNNQGSDWAYYPNTFGPDTDSTYSQFIPESYKNQIPTYTGVWPEVGGFHTDGLGSEPIYDSTISLATQNFTLQQQGYIYVETTGVYNFYVTNGDDCAFLWLGTLAFSGWTRSNAFVTACYTFAGPGQGSHDWYATVGTYIPYRVMLAQAGQQGGFYLNVTGPDGSSYVTSDSGTSSRVEQYACNTTMAQPFPPWGQQS